jgi:hypothetical protein
MPKPPGSGPQKGAEARLMAHSKKNVREGKTVKHPDGSESTMLTGSQRTARGRELLIPHVYDGRVVSPKEARERAAGKGFPTYTTPAQATAASKRLSKNADPAPPKKPKRGPR